jgi:hypothetical protein
MMTAESLAERSAGYDLPLHTRDALFNYIVYGDRQGHFVSAVLMNDLRESVARADDLNQQAIVSIVKFLYNEAPSACWGSTQKVELWISQSGLGSDI